MENENKLKGLVEFLNTAFRKAGFDCTASVDSVNECATVKYGISEAIAYEVYPLGKSHAWELFTMVSIPQTRDTPEDFDVETIGFAQSVPEVFCAILRHTLEDNLLRWVENASLELNPDDGGLF